MDEIMYGLLGKTLKHSYSPRIYQSMGIENYRLIEVDHSELSQLLTTKQFKGLNVTIPYKETVLEYLSSQDEISKMIGCVNTIVNRDNRLIGYNTDVLGFHALLDYYNVDVRDKDILILGTGATSKTVEFACRSRSAKSISFASRNKDESRLLYSDLEDKYDIIVNTTPVGMFPNNSTVPLDITKFNRCNIVVDVVYNPLKTRLIIDAEANNKRAYGGLYMLVAQAVYSYGLFTDTIVSSIQIDTEYTKLYKELINIVLIGLSGSGKTSISNLFTYRIIVNIDHMIESIVNDSIENIFKNAGEAYFRNIEHKMVERYYKDTGLVIDCGGGIILNDENMKLLKQNGIVFLVERDLEKIILNYNRPLVNDEFDLTSMYNLRKEKYHYYADCIIINNDTIDSCRNEIEEMLNEVVSN